MPYQTISVESSLVEEMDNDRLTAKPKLTWTEYLRECRLAWKEKKATR